MLESDRIGVTCSMVCVAGREVGKGTLGVEGVREGMEAVKVKGERVWRCIEGALLTAPTIKRESEREGLDIWGGRERGRGG